MLAAAWDVWESGEFVLKGDQKSLGGQRSQVDNEERCKLRIECYCTRGGESMEGSLGLSGF